MTDFKLNADRQFNSPADAAKYYVEIGFEPIPVPPREKRPKTKWKEPVQWTGFDIEQKFRPDANIGIALGHRSGDLGDLDFDSPEAARIGCDLFSDLPSFGRASSHHSHRVFRAKLSKGVYRFQIPNDASHLFDVDRLMVMEVRGNGHQTMFPPSVHPTGESVRWHDAPETIPQVDAEDIVRRAGLVSFLAVIANKFPKTAGNRDEVCLALTGVLVRTGASDIEIDHWVTLVAQIAGDEEADKRGSKAAATREKLDAGEQVWGLPALCEQLGIGKIENTLRLWLGENPKDGTCNESAIVVRPGFLPQAIDQAESALLAANLNIYQRSGALVRVARVTVSIQKEGISRDTGSLILKIVSPPWLTEKFALTSRWERQTKKGNVRINPPNECATTYIARVGDWKLPFLQGIAQSPTLREDGSVLQEPGYDKISGLFYDPGRITFAKVPDAPSRSEAVAALAILMAPFRGFQFASKEDESVAIAAALTALVRSMFPTAPMFAIDAPTAGTGKSLLTETVGIIATGHKPAMMSQGKSEEEDEKRLSSVLIAGDQVIIIDNCDRPIQGDFLCSMLTQERAKPRILGKSEMRQVPTRCLVMATGNNLVLVGDITRRVLICRLDAEVERPDQRQFDFDPRQEAFEQRPELVVAGLTILRAYIAAGRPKPLDKIGSFEDWNLIREALVWLDQADPAKTRDRVLADDPQKAVLIDLLRLWWQVLGDQPVTLAELGTIASGDPNDPANELTTELISNTRYMSFNARSIGHFLVKHVDRIVGGMMLRASTDSSGIKRYRIVKTRSRSEDPPEVEEIPF